ncbi:hypothetical protein Bca52824_061461 [Brassica carinata]|uniref:glutaredoxin-dependent peroxiredoxin n=1 Tax=Brassica carinata TaxID=52824 RepID=A0A8X7QZF2_BRACI|nr:hypothetical protein Bca52824_061461 [Brassica carinata]
MFYQMEKFSSLSERSARTVSVHSLLAGKKVILFGVPGAFTSACSLQHVPSFIEKAEPLKAKGVNEIISMAHGERHSRENKHVKFVSRRLGEYTKLRFELDLKDKGLGIRTRRFAMLLDNLKVIVANIETGGEFTVSSAEDILKAL